MNKNPVHISVVFPVYNEAGNVRPFLERLSGTLRGMGAPYEIIAVDDGSTDDSYAQLMHEKKKVPHLSLIRFQRNFGQTAALSAGIESAHGDVIVTIDSDLENDPADIPRLVEKLDEGYDVISGWRQNRWESAFFTRQLPSKAANWLISRLSGVPLHDYGCTLKAYRASVIKGVRLYGEMHRFIPAYAAWQGGRVAELPVKHTPRTQGASKYGFGRVFKVLLDLVVVVFLHRYMNRPMHFFGGLGFVSLLVGVAAGLAAVLLKVMGLKSFVATPLPVFSALFIIVGVQLVMFGVIAEMLMRIYYESQDRRPYLIVDEGHP